MRMNGERWLKNYCATFHHVKDVRGTTQQMFTRSRHELEVEASPTEITLHCFAGLVIHSLHRIRHKVSLKVGSRTLGMNRLSPMNWTDTVGVTIHNDLVRSALKNKPDADIDKLEASVKRMSLSVGITRNAIASVIEAEVEAMLAYRALGDTSLTPEYVAGLQSAADLVRYGLHLSDGIKL